ncbi:hypothetical protein FACS1894122_00270 [Alphaproteobacteria bacterium]|nr:hypothetical protein FACS1894122_00110 [Alphaproteobacteria bacterium]GHT90329.1 hypothetical protein FACS1894122_00270 [Alphaproteobacteria bacterium]
MHKNEIEIYGLACLAFILLMACVFKKTKFEEVFQEKESALFHKNNLEKLAYNISQSSFPAIKLCDDASNYNAQKHIRDCAKKASIDKVMLKNKATNDKYFRADEMGIQLSAKKERDIYSFLREIYAQSPGPVEVDSIGITKRGKNDFVAKIQCRLYLFDKNSLQNFVKPMKNKSMFDIGSVSLFQSDDEEHKLHCVIENEKAFVDNNWINVGDTIDGSTVKKIGYESIDLESKGKLDHVKIGSSFIPRGYEISGN